MVEKKKEPTGNRQKSVLAFIRGRRALGATDWEVERALNLSHQSASARRRELVLRGLVRDSGNTRMGGAGRKISVWVAPS